MRSEQIATLLAGVDAFLVPQGFARRKQGQEWRKRIDAANVAWVHVNVGLGIINPSLGVSYSDLVGVLPKDVGPVCGVVRMLGALFEPSHSYSLVDGAQRIVDDISAEGMTALTELLDRKAAVRALRSVAPKDWPVLGYSARIRLLPLLLATSGAESDALEVAAQLSIEAAARDQSLPNYGTFHDALRQRFAV